MADNDLAAAISANYGRKRDAGEAKRRLAYAMMQQGTDTSPILHPMQGVSRLAQTLAGVLVQNRADEESAAKDKARSEEIGRIGGIADPQERLSAYTKIDPEIGMKYGAQLAVEQAKIAQQKEGLKTGGSGLYEAYGMTPPQGGQQQAGAPPQTPGGSAPDGFNNNVGNIRVSNANWQDRGQPHNGFETFATPDAGARAMYQNLSSYARKNPQMTVGQAIATWAPPSENNTQAYVARIAQAGIDPNTPLAQVLQNPQVAGRLMLTMGVHEKGGLPRGFTPDTFIAAAGGQPQVAQGDNPQAAPGMPPAPSPQGVAGPAVIAPPQLPQRPTQPSRQILAQAEALYKAGRFGPDKATADRNVGVWIDQQVAHEFEAQKLKFQQDSDLYKDERKRAGDAPLKNIENEGKLRDDYTGNQQFKDYRKANTVFRSAVQASKVDSAAADLNMVYAFATLMDPGSVVRDSETGMVIATQNASDRVKAMVASVTGGSRLSPESRAALMNEMGTRYEAYKAAHDDLGKTYKGIAGRIGANPDNVVIPMPPVEWERPQTKAMPQAGGGGAQSGLPSASAIDAELARRSRGR